jgi:2-oxoglutarate dehydrogenase E1 component
LPDNATLGDILETLKQTYCGTIGVEYMYMTDYNEKRWLQERLESIRSRPSYSADQKKRILERLTAAETLERYLHTKYVGQKRFSLEGGESLIVAMDEAIRTGGANGVDEIVVGMAHRGRLNVLVNTWASAVHALRRIRRQEEERSDRWRRQVPHGLLVRRIHPGGPAT